MKQLMRTLLDALIQSPDTYKVNPFLLDSLDQILGLVDEDQAKRLRDVFVDLQKSSHKQIALAKKYSDELDKSSVLRPPPTS